MCVNVSSLDNIVGVSHSFCKYGQEQSRFWGALHFYNNQTLKKIP